jgi:hypothetical protein
LFKPFFDFTLGSHGIDNLGEIDFLTFDGVHGVNFLFGIKFKLRNTFETFLKMGLYFRRLLGFREDFEKFFIRKEEESGEETTLGL